MLARYLCAKVDPLRWLLLAETEESERQQNYLTFYSTSDGRRPSHAMCRLWRKSPAHMPFVYVALLSNVVCHSSLNFCFCMSSRVCQRLERYDGHLDRRKKKKKLPLWRVRSECSVLVALLARLFLYYRKADNTVSSSVRNEDSKYMRG